MKTERNSNIELLRILAMFAIIAGHFVSQSGTFEYTSCVNDFLLVFISSGGRIAVNVFLLIGVWYMVDAKFSVARILKMYGELYLYSALFSIIAYVFDKNVTFMLTLRGFLPFSKIALWFANSYICLLLLKPFLDRVLQWERPQLLYFICLIFSLLSIQSTILAQQDGIIADTVWFSEIYLVIGFIKKYSYKVINNKFLSLILFVGGYIALVGMAFISLVVNIDNLMFSLCHRASSVYLSDIKSLPNILLAFFIFDFFISAKPNCNKIINSMSKGIFSTYIIHQVPAFYPFLWSVIFNSEAWLLKHNVLYVIFVAISVFTVCSLIDVTRRKWLEPAFIKTKLFNFIVTQIEKVYN